MYFKTRWKLIASVCEAIIAVWTSRLDLIPHLFQDGNTPGKMDPPADSSYFIEWIPNNMKYQGRDDYFQCVGFGLTWIAWGVMMIRSVGFRTNELQKYRRRDDEVQCSNSLHNRNLQFIRCVVKWVIDDEFRFGRHHEEFEICFKFSCQQFWLNLTFHNSHDVVNHVPPQGALVIALISCVAQPIGKLSDITEPQQDLNA